MNKPTVDRKTREQWRRVDGNRVENFLNSVLIVLITLGFAGIIGVLAFHMVIGGAG